MRLGRVDAAGLADAVELRQQPSPTPGSSDIVSSKLGRIVKVGLPGAFAMGSRAMTQDSLLLTATIAWTAVVSGVLAYMALTH